MASKELFAAALAAVFLVGACTAAPGAKGGPSGSFRSGERRDALATGGFLRRGNLSSGLTYTYGEQGVVGGVSGPDHRNIWNFSCHADAMAGQRKCMLHGTPTTGPATPGGITFYGSGPGAWSEVCVAGNDFPGRAAMLRFDAGSPVTTASNGCSASQSVIRRALHAKVIHTRYTHWPYGGTADATVETTALAPALDLMRFRIKQR